MIVWRQYIPKTIKPGATEIGSVSVNDDSV